MYTPRQIIKTVQQHATPNLPLRRRRGQVFAARILIAVCSLLAILGDPSSTTHAQDETTPPTVTNLIFLPGI
ncbi:MAG: hypothetical protein KDD84_17250, partial [Caldilineaceae bacterium]|nr:hypothetical protein [Caldilineaceae bacterium]